MTGKRAVGMVIIVAATATAVGLLLQSRLAGNDEWTASGTVEATESDLGFPLPGQIAALAVREGDRVSPGQELASLVDAEPAARVAAAEAQVAAARAQLAEAQRGPRVEEIAQARAGVAAAASRLEDARRDAERARVLFDGGAISREALDRASTGAQVAEAAHVQASEQLAALERGTRPERIAAAGAQLRQSEAALEQARAVLANTRIAAPFAGIVTVRHREPGEVLGAGVPVVSVMNPEDRWVRIYVPETRIGVVSIGQGAVITSDSHGEREFAGEVSVIADEAEFTPRNVQTPEERTKLVYAVKIRVTGDPDILLKPGITVDVRLR
jgi:HlyD family secretion protein